MPLYFSLSLHIPFSLSLNTFVFTCLVKIVILQISAQMSPICETFPALQKHTESTSPLFSKCHSPALCHIALLGKYLFSCLFFSLNESHLKEKHLCWQAIVPQTFAGWKNELIFSYSIFELIIFTVTCHVTSSFPFFHSTSCSLKYCSADTATFP